MVVMPHYMFSTYEEVKDFLQHIRNYKTLLRHIDVREITKFIVYVNNNCQLNVRYQLENYFESVDTITINSLKRYYLSLIHI